SLRQGTPTAAREAPRDAPSPPSLSPEPRVLSAEQRSTMLEVLNGETGSVKKVWFQVEQSRPEPVAFQKALPDVFREAGWEVDTAGSGGMTFKPGMSLLVADEEWPSYASTAYDALQRAGI